ncbi:MAG: response regulator transcription factor [Lachnospiraceae bacterium]|nr:response regulator transcription factor [Lachnospiraceae bacterium]
MLKIAIVEDNATEREQLLGLLRNYEKTRDCPMEICVYADGSEILAAYPEGISLIFMDIDMKRLNGIETAKKIREFDPAVILVFLTNMVQYALAGYEVEALDFLVKPLDDYKLSWEMKRILKKIEESKPFYLLARDNYTTHSINADEIYYVETAQRKLVIHTTSRDILCNMTMHEAEKQLSPRHFFRIHTAFLVNLKYVRLVRENEIMVGDIVLPISRYRKKEFRTVFTAFMGNAL